MADLDLTDRERLIILSTKMDTMIDTVTETKKDIKEMGTKIDTVDEKLRKDFVTKTEFEPIRRLVYGAVGIMLTTVVLGLLALIIKSQAGVGVLP
jgi:ABC-type phosphate transport system permease subunit